VFFDGNKGGRLQPTDHVGSYPGYGHLIHPSNYFGEVVEGKMKMIDGCWGAKMTRLRWGATRHPTYSDYDRYNQQ
jgi:hypothetical protein